jgi:hypothetical protein
MAENPHGRRFERLRQAACRRAMTLHLIKLCVGVETLADLRAWRASRAAEGRPAVVHTRQTPKRVDELLDGGSLYWVIKGAVVARQRLEAIHRVEEGGQSRCEILLDETLRPTVPQPRRPFQGWRYFEAKDAPPDLETGEGGDVLPGDLARRLREMGAW